MAIHLFSACQELLEFQHGVIARWQITHAGQRNHYQEFGVAVELDGQAAHPVDARWRDIHRDNARAEVGIVTLRYGWTDVTMEPCRVAAEVARVLRNHGWNGHPRACGPGCTASSA